METKGGGVFFSRFGWARSCRCPVENKTEEEGVGGKGKASSYWLPRFEWGAPTNRCASALETPYHPPVWEDKGKSFLELTKKIKKNVSANHLPLSWSVRSPTKKNKLGKTWLKMKLKSTVPSFIWGKKKPFFGVPHDIFLFSFEDFFVSIQWRWYIATEQRTTKPGKTQ